METKLSAQQVLEELRCIAFARTTDYSRVKDGVLTVVDSSTLTPAQMAAVSSIEKVAGGVKVKLYDKLKALELLGKAMGLFDGVAAEPENNNLLDAILLATEQEVDTLDLPEVQQTAAAGDQLVEPAGAEII